MLSYAYLLTDGGDVASSVPATSSAGVLTLESETWLASACTPIDTPMIACTRGSRATPHTLPPPAAVSAVRVLRECPKTPACATSTRLPSHPGSASSTYETSRTRSAMLFGTLAFEQSPGPNVGRGGRPSLHGINRVPACWLMKSIRTSSAVLFA